MTVLHQLAEAAGLAREWFDANGQHHVVDDAALAAILSPLGYPCDDDQAIRASLDKRADELGRTPLLLTAEVGEPTLLPTALTGASAAVLVAEDGSRRELEVIDAQLPGIAEPGYYNLQVGALTLTLAVAPRRCFSIADVSDTRLWGPAVQIPSLRDDAERPYGGLGELAATAALFGERGAQALAISPLHALYPGIGSKFSPYSPSSRLFLNAALADPALVGLPPLPERPGAELIAWNEAVPQRLADLRAVFDGLDGDRRAEITAWAAAEGPVLQRHALHDALYVHFHATIEAWGWPQWPTEYHDPHGAAARQFGMDHAEDVAFHTFAQWLAASGLAAAQATAREHGMGVGLIADLAVGVDPWGADTWNLGDAMFSGLSIGAPPDPLGPEGQNWGLTGFSPMGLQRTGFAPWIAMLRAALVRAGGLRIDHAFGLRRLWIIPTGLPASHGAYLTLPFADLMRLIALESHRARAIIVAEDLGTMPGGFEQAIAERTILGMRVLWFERDAAGAFRAPQHYAPLSVAMTGTHDTATVAGWWIGRDIDWAEWIGRLPSAESRAREEAYRVRDRTVLWRAIGGDRPEPDKDDPAPVVEAALVHVGHAASRLSIAPLEDILALEEQPNVPGTVDAHPNWRRRLGAPLGDLLADPATVARIAALEQARDA